MFTLTVMILQRGSCTPEGGTQNIKYAFVSVIMAYILHI